MIRSLRAPALAICLATVNGCAMLSPYTPVAERFCNSIPPPRDASGRAESCHFSQTFENNAQNTAYFSSTSTIVLAGALGLGAYKSIVASSGHQYVALAAGGGALYGTGVALYKPTREQVWMGGSAALSCIDNFYSDLDPAVGEYYYKKLTPEQRAKISTEYLSIMFLAEMYDDQYKANVQNLAKSINQLLSTLQPTTAQSYSTVKTSINESIASISKSELTTKLVISETQDAENNKAVLALANWMVRAFERHTQIKTNHLKPECSIFSSDLVVAEFPLDGKLKLKKDAKQQYTILDGSGLLTIKKSPDSTNVVAKLESSNNIRSFVIEGKAITTEPIFVTLIDSNSGASRTLEVTVEP